MRSELSQRLLRELLKNSRRSDRMLAKVLGVSPPTVTRARRKLERDGMIEGYTIIPNFKKMGYELMAITVGRYKAQDMRTPELLEQVQKWVAAHPSIIFASQAEGMGKDAVTISLHKNFTDYARFMREIRLKFGAVTQDHEGVLISLGERVARPLSLKRLEDQGEK